MWLFLASCASTGEADRAQIVRVRMVLAVLTSFTRKSVATPVRVGGYASIERPATRPICVIAHATQGSLSKNR